MTVQLATKINEKVKRMLGLVCERRGLKKTGTEWMFTANGKKAVYFIGLISKKIFEPRFKLCN